MRVARYWRLKEKNYRLEGVRTNNSTELLSRPEEIKSEADASQVADTQKKSFAA